MRPMAYIVYFKLNWKEEWIGRTVIILLIKMVSGCLRKYVGRFQFMEG